MNIENIIRLFFFILEAFKRHLAQKSEVARAPLNINGHDASACTKGGEGLCGSSPVQLGHVQVVDVQARLTDNYLLKETAYLYW